MTIAWARLVLILAALCSAAMMWSGVKNISYATTAWSAAAFAVAAAAIGLAVNAPQWSEAIAVGSVAERQLEAMRGNAQLCAIVYAWGAGALAAAYKLTWLYWQHGLQYACGMLLFAAIFFGWSQLARPGGRFANSDGAKRAAQLNVVHGGAAAIAAAIFLISGKFWVSRPDWAANLVFLAGGFSIISLCLLAAITHWRASRNV
jgi:hypothetical protein